MNGGLDVYLLGAGASHGSLDCEPGVPPLGCELYERLLERPGFRDAIPRQFVPDRQSLEVTLSKLWDEHTEHMIPVLRETALFFSEFRPKPTNLYVELGRRIRSRASQTVLASLNFEMLLEMALFGSGVPCHYEGTFPAQGATILKLHGSANFLPTVAGAMLSDGSLLRAVERTGLASCNAIQIVNDPSLIHAYVKSTGLPPMVAAFMPNKPVPFCRDVIRDLWETWLRSVRVAETLTIIGVDLSGLGSHVSDPLRALRGKIVYVGPDPDARDKLAAMAPLASYVTVAAPSFHAYLGARIDTPSYHLW